MMPVSHASDALEGLPEVGQVRALKTLVQLTIEKFQALPNGPPSISVGLSGGI
jgi:hypothetical protein